jgi:hypothetical protein
MSNCEHGIPDGIGCMICDTDGAAEACGWTDQLNTGTPSTEVPQHPSRSIDPSLGDHNRSTPDAEPLPVSGLSGDGHLLWQLYLVSLARRSRGDGECQEGLAKRALEDAWVFLGVWNERGDGE